MPAPSFTTRTWQLIGVACAAVAVALAAIAVQIRDANPDDTTTTTGDTTPTTQEPTTGTTPTTDPTTTTTAGGPMTVPASCRPAATNGGTEVRQDWPTDESTGPSGLGLDEDRLPASGKPSTWTITAPNTVVEGVYHHGRILVAASGVRIVGSVVCGTGRSIVEVQSGGAGLAIEDSIIVGEKGTVMGGAGAGQPCESAVAFGGFTIDRSELQGCVDGVKVQGKVHVRDSYFHDNYANRGGSDGTHNDTVQYQSTSAALSDFVFSGNAAYQDPCTSNRHFQMAPSPSGGSGGVWRIERNLFYGIHLINVDRGTRVADGTMTDNVLAGGRTRGPSEPPYYLGDGISTIDRSGNTFEDGSAIDSNPSGVSYVCVAG